MIGAFKRTRPPDDEEQGSRYRQIIVRDILYCYSTSIHPTFSSKNSRPKRKRFLPESFYHVDGMLFMQDASALKVIHAMLYNTEPNQFPRRPLLFETFADVYRTLPK
jgi:hypothetical protein